MFLDQELKSNTRSANDLAQVLICLKLNLLLRNTMKDKRIIHIANGVIMLLLNCFIITIGVDLIVHL